MNILEELRILSKEVCNTAIDRATREKAEKRLLEIQNNDESWQVLLEMVPYCENELLFYIAQGLLNSVRRTWVNLSEQETNYFTSIILRTLTTRSDISKYVRSKIEQILGSICVSSASLTPVLQLISGENSTNMDYGLSAFRTTLEMVFDSMNRIAPEEQQSLLKQVQDIAMPMTNLIADICRNTSTAPQEQSKLLLAVDLLNILVAKIPVGSHITMDVLNLLLSMVERGAMRSASGEGPSASAHLQAMRATDVLVELMGKKYLPRNGNEDTSGDVLVELLKRVVQILRVMSAAEMLPDEEEALVEQLMLFVAAFVEHHLDRCLASPSQMMANIIGTFVDELLAVTLAMTQLRSLLRTLQVWELFLGDGIRRADLVFERSGVRLAMYILESSLLLRNTELQESWDEIEDGSAVDVFVDTHTNEILAHIISDETKYSVTANANNDESSDAATLVHVAETCLTSLYTSNGCRESLHSAVSLQVQLTISTMMSNGNNSINNSSSNLCNYAALDCPLLLRLLSISSPTKEITPQLCTLLLQLVQGRYYSRGRAYLSLLVAVTHLTGRLITSANLAVDDIATSLPCVLSIVQTVYDTTISPAPATVMSAASWLLLQFSQAVVPLGKFASLPPHLTDWLQNISTELQTLTIRSERVSPSEANTLLWLSSAVLCPSLTSTWLLSELEGLQSKLLVGSHATVIMSASSFATRVHSLIRLYSHMSPSVRQSLAIQLTALPDGLPPLLMMCFQSVSTIVIVSRADGRDNTMPGKLSSVIASSTQLVALAGGAMECLGGKIFGPVAIKVLEISTSFIESFANVVLDGRSLVADGAGLALIKQVLRLCLQVSTCVSNKYVDIQTKSVEAVVTAVSTAMQQAGTVLHTILLDVLTVGWSCIQCHWNHSSSSSGTNAVVGGGEVNNGWHSTAGAANGRTNASAIVNTAGILLQLTLLAMDPVHNVSPQVIRVALEGLLSVHERHTLLITPWFMTQWWMQFTVRCIRTLIHRTLESERDIVELLLTALGQASVTYDTASDSTVCSDVIDGRLRFLQLLQHEVLTAAQPFGDKLMQQTRINLTKVADNDKIHLDIGKCVSRILVPLSTSILLYKSTKM